MYTPIFNAKGQDSKNETTFGPSQIVLFQPDKSIRLDVKLENETVWLTQAQMVLLFERDQSVISRHIRNIFKEGELDKDSVYANFAYTATDGKIYEVEHYNLDVIISVGYRVKSQRGILFRQWANRILKEYILKGYAINQRFERIEQRVTTAEKKIDFFVRMALPPVEGIFYDGQIFDAYKFASDLIKSAKNFIVLIDNYIDESVLMLLSKRATSVDANIYTAQISQQLQLDLQRHNAQYQPITIHVLTRSHDRFLLIDNEIYHIGASLKDLGKKWFAFSKMTLDANELLVNL
jgi:hypothetical protein